MSCRRWVESEFNPVTLRSPRMMMKQSPINPSTPRSGTGVDISSVFDLTRRYAKPMGGLTVSPRTSSLNTTGNSVINSKPLLPENIRPMGVSDKVVSRDPFLGGLNGSGTVRTPRSGYGKQCYDDNYSGATDMNSNNLNNFVKVSESDSRNVRINAKLENERIIRESMGRNTNMTPRSGKNNSDSNPLSTLDQTIPNQRQALIANDNIRNLRTSDGMIANMSDTSYSTGHSPGKSPLDQNDFRPSWLKYHRKVLCFSAFFQENVPNSKLENARVRIVNIYYFLEDGTICVDEPKVTNSGLIQGCLVTRGMYGSNLFPGIDPKTKEIGLLKSGNTITLNGRCYRICKPDGFTIEFYKNNNWDIGDYENKDNEIPKDAFQIQEAKLIEQNKIARSSMGFMTNSDVNNPSYNTKRRQNVKNQNLSSSSSSDSQNALRFYAFSLNQKTKTVTYYTLCYFLADETCLIHERTPRNSGRDNSWTTLFKRGLLKKNPCVSAVPGMLEPTTELYSPSDFFIGAPIQVSAFTLYLYAADKYTRTWYAEQCKGGVKEGSSGFDDIEKPLEQDMTVYEAIKRQFNGLEFKYSIGGSGAKNLEAMSNEELEKYYKDLQSQRERSHEISTGRYHTGIVVNKPTAFSASAAMHIESVLRFEANLEINDMSNKNQIVDENRRFILSLDTITKAVSVWEIKPTARLELRNSGHKGGKFLDNIDVHDLGPYYSGNVVTVNGRKFRLGRSDEASLRYMELHCDQFPYSDIQRILLNISMGCQEKLNKIRFDIDQDPETIKMNGGVTVKRFPVMPASTNMGSTESDGPNGTVDNESRHAITKNPSVTVLLFQSELLQYIEQKGIVKRRNSGTGFDEDRLTIALSHRPGPKISPDNLKRKIKEKLNLDLNSQEMISLVRECAVQGETEILIGPFLLALEKVMGGDTSEVMEVTKRNLSKSYVG